MLKVILTLPIHLFHHLLLKFMLKLKLFLADPIVHNERVCGEACKAES